jgi:hypothetical protein
MIFVLKPLVEINSADDLSEKQEPAVIVDALKAMFPSSVWQREGDGSWFGSFNVPDGWYEFRIGPQLDFTCQICTSHGGHSLTLIRAICSELRVLAFDGPSNTCCDPGRRLAVQKSLGPPFTSA